MRHCKKIFYTMFSAIFILSIQAFCADDIHFQDIRSIQNIIPQQTKFYTISPNVGIDNAYYQFTINSNDVAPITVTGIPELIKTLHEISVIDWYKSTPQGNQVWKGAKDSVKGIGKGAKTIILHPGDAGAAIGKSIAKTGRSIGQFFKGLVKKKPKSSSGKDLSKGAGGFFASDTARQAAYELHLDVYSKNPMVQALLSEIGNERWAGSIGVSAASYFATPGLHTVGSVATGALTPGAKIDKIEKMIRDNSPYELNRVLLKMFVKYMHYDKNTMEYNLFKAFLENPNYSPHTKAYIALYINQLKHVKNLKKALSVLANCHSVQNANILNYQLQMMAAVDKNTDNVKFSSYATAKNRIYGIISSGDLIAILPFDYANNSKFMQNEVKMIPHVKATRSIWLLGDATSGFITMAKKNGIDAVYDGILKFGAFKAKNIKSYINNQ